MGKISGLESFCLSNNKFFQNIDILDEIAEWRRENGKDPTIVIDVKELNRFLGNRDSEQSFAEALDLGGQYWKFNRILEIFFGEMKKAMANLVFIVRLSEGRYKDMNEWNKRISTIDPNERFLYNLLHICSKYGQLSLNYGNGKRTVLSYARENRDTVMALITRNAPYLVYDIDFSYWSLSHVVFDQMKIVKFCQKQMLQDLELSTIQMQIIKAIFKLDFDWLKHFIGKKGSRFQRVVEYLEPLRIDEKEFDLDELKSKMSNYQRKIFEDSLSRIFIINDYAGKWNEDSYDGMILDLIKTNESFKSMLKFFKENIYFAYKLINETDSTQKDLLCIEDGNFSKLIVNIIVKMIGILFKDVDRKKRPKTRTFQQMNVYNTSYEASTMDIIYPPTPWLASLKDLIIEEDDESFDAQRWSLLTWLLDLDPMTIFNIRFPQGFPNESKFIRIVYLTLKFLKKHKLISEREAKIIVQIEEDRDKKQSRLSQTSSVPPSKLDGKFSKINDASAQTAHKYTIAFKLICHCLEVSGLRKETALIMFDGPKFNVRM